MPPLIRNSVHSGMLQWGVVSDSLTQTTDCTHVKTHTLTDAPHASPHCLQIPPRLNFAAEQYQGAAKTNTGPRGLIVRTRVPPVETWDLLAHSAPVSGFALTDRNSRSPVPRKEKKRYKRKAYISPCSAESDNDPSGPHARPRLWMRRPKTSQSQRNRSSERQQATQGWNNKVF